MARRYPPVGRLLTYLLPISRTTTQGNRDEKGVECYGDKPDRITFERLALLHAMALAGRICYHVDVAWWVFALAAVMAMAIALFTVSYRSIRAALMPRKDFEIGVN